MKISIRRALGITILIVICLSLLHASVWEGSAVVGNYGDFPASGNFAACNSFARNTVVEVRNLENGRTTTVIVTRGLDVPGVFMLLSADAARDLAIPQGSLVRIRASLPRGASTLGGVATGRTTDPDFNPRRLAEDELARLGYLFPDAVIAPVAPTPPPVVEAPPAVVEAPPAVVEAPPAVVEAPPAVVEAPPAVVEAPPAVPEAPPIVATQPPAREDPVALEPRISPPDQAQAAVTPAVPPAILGPVTHDYLASSDSGETLKPRPVRTVVLSSLPEPLPPSEADPPAAPIAQVEVIEPSASTEPMVRYLPLPDQAPLRLAAEPEPRRQQELALMPDSFERVVPGLSQTPWSASLSEPGQPSPQVGFQAHGIFVSGGPEAVPALALAEPAMPEYRGPERASIYDRIGLSAPESHLELLLANPDLAPDELPEVYLGWLHAPAPTIPASALMDGEVRFAQVEHPTAISRETPYFAALDTQVELAQAETKAAEAAQVSHPAMIAQPEQQPSLGLVDAPQPAAEQPPAQTETIVALTPTAPRPPETVAPAAPVAPAAVAPPAVAPPAVAPPAVAPPTVSAPTAPVPGRLEPGKFYIQLAAYSSEAAARLAASTSLLGYDFVIEPVQVRGTTMFRLYAGPFGRDESGVVLLQFRSTGFRDAFVKSGG